MILKQLFIVFSCIITITSMRSDCKNYTMKQLDKNLTRHDRLKVKCYVDPPNWIPWTVDGEGLSEELLITSSYKTGKAPSLLTPVSVLFKNSKIMELNEQNEQLTILVNIIAFWEDSRIKIAHSKHSGFIELPDITKTERHIWKPFDNLIFPEAKEVSFLFYPIIASEIIATSGKLANQLLKKKQYPSDTTVIVANFQWKVTIPCNTDFSAYPFDTQTCRLRMMSKRINVSIAKLPELYREYSNPNTKIKGYHLVADELSSTYGNHLSSSIKSTEFGVTISLTRKFASFFYLYYIPCIVVVTISFISFTVPLEAAAGRVGLLVTPFLSLITIYIHERSSCPERSSLNSLSKYLLGSMFFILFVIIQMSMILLYKRKARWNHSLPIINGCQKSEEIYKLRHAEEIHLMCKIDFVCLILAIVSYAVFNFIYFGIYL